jgi:hypothetical protein
VEVAAAHASAKAGHTNVAHRKQERDGSKVLSHRGTSTTEWGLGVSGLSFVVIATVGNDKLIETVLPLFVSKMLAFP